jgi:hypothetical protein
MTLPGLEDREFSPSLVRVEIEQLACCEPAGIGLSMTHWSNRSLAKIAMERGIGPRIAHSTVSLILRDADLQPHRSRYCVNVKLEMGNYGGGEVGRNVGEKLPPECP